jgi:hypothetical protein
MHKLLLLSFTASVAIAADMSLMISGRQSSCQIGEKVCGTGCISIADTCCPDGSGGCPLSQYCELGSNNQYGCCPIGEVCSGNGGVKTCAEQGQKDCGSDCIDLSWTCCPDKLGGCAATEFCELGSNNQYGCCPNGEVCAGNGGASTTGAGTVAGTVTHISTSTPSPTQGSTPPPTQAPTQTQTSVSTTATPIETTSATSTTSSKPTAATTSPALLTGAGNEGHRAPSAAYMFGAVLAALFMFF